MTANRSDCLLGRPCQPRNRRERIHCLVHHSKQTAHELADTIGRRYDRLIAYASVNDTAELPVRDLIALTKATGRTFALAAEVAECGYLLVQHPHASSDADEFSELTDVFVGTGQLAHAHKTHAEHRSPDTLTTVIAAARVLQTEVAEFIIAAETTTAPMTRVIR